jgi:arginase family enzyme
MSNTKTSLPRSIRKLFPQVQSVVDSDVTIEVSVNRKDCKDATKMNPSNCALARATKRELHADGVIIGLSSSYVIKGDVAVRFATPESVQREIISFDRHQDFATGEYTLRPKSPTNRLNSGNYKHKTGKNKKVTRRLHTSARVRILERGHSSK